MKKIFLLLLAAGALFSCQEEFNVEQVEQVSGGAILSYVLPDDRDLLYVQAEYTLDTGEKMIVKSSMYGTQIKIDGFAKAEPRKVTLYAVDRSHNCTNSIY